jgi:methylmalonyl-CoA/ethylmalonyl-CoA epimerase
MTAEEKSIFPDIFKKVEHIGIAVEDLSSAGKKYRLLLGVDEYKREEVPSEGVRTAFYKVGDTKIELLEATDDASPIARFIEKRGAGIHHIAFEVDDIHRSMQRLREAGFKLTRDVPVRGADHKLVCFIHPKSTGGTLIELCQEIREGSSDL